MTICIFIIVASNRLQPVSDAYSITETASKQAATCGDFPSITTYPQARGETVHRTEGNTTMYQPMNVELAYRFGMAAAIAAQCLWDGLDGQFEAETETTKGSLWIRMGRRQLSLLIPYLSPHMAKSALRRLVKGGILRTADLNESPFDHTYWYAFTAYGKCLMAVACEDRQERP
jgi:hypothetical protein